MSKSWVVTLEEDENGDLILPLSDEILENTGISLGDTVEWIDNGDGSWTLQKKEEMVWVMVEALQTFRMRYMVEVPKDNPEWALDTVTMNEAKEFSQEALPEVISSYRVMDSLEAALKQCDIDNDYTKSWNDEQKINAFFTKDGEKVKL
jgi:hypothetical protein